jgi:hypothetical protein
MEIYIIVKMHAWTVPKTSIYIYVIDLIYNHSLKPYIRDRDAVERVRYSSLDARGRAGWGRQ